MSTPAAPLLCAICQTPLPPLNSTPLCLTCQLFQPQPAESEATSGDEYYKLAVRLYNQGQYNQAVYTLETAEQLKPGRYGLEKIYLLRGYCHDKLQQWSLAIHYYRLTLSEAPYRYEALLGLGIVHRLLGKYDEAESYYTQALRLRPDTAEIHCSLGVLYLARGQVEAGYNALCQALQLNPHLAVAQANLAYAYALKGEFVPAEELLEQARLNGYAEYDVMHRKIEQLKQP